MAITTRSVTLNDSVLLSHPSQQVWFKVRWADEWELADETYCSSLSWALNPSQSTAQFVKNYDPDGLSTATAGRNASTTGSPLDGSTYLRLEVSGLPAWHGIGVEIAKRVWGDQTAPQSDHSTAFGLEWLLERAFLKQSLQVDADGTGVETVNRVIQVNRPTAAQFGNMQEVEQPFADTQYVFSRDLIDAKPWTAKKFLGYVFNEFGLLGIEANADAVKIPVRLDLDEMADWDLEPFDPAGMSYVALLDKVIARDRGLAWITEVEDQPDDFWGDPQPDRLVIRAVSTLKESVTIGSADSDDGVVAELLANERQVTVNVSKRSVDELEIRDSVTQQADVFEAVGERCGFVGTFAIADNGSLVTVLEPNWTDELELQYEAGFSADASYAGLGDTDKRARNSAVRGSDVVRDVYRSFRVPASWMSYGRLGDGSGAVALADRYPAFPVLNDQAEIEQSGIVRDPADLADKLDADVFHWPELRFQPEMPLVQGIDYSGDAIYQGTATTPNNASDTHRFLPPLVLFQITRDETAASYWAHGERMTREDYSSSVEDGINYSVDVDVRPDAFSFEVNVIGADQHFIADADFADLGADDWAAQQKRAVDYNSMLVTAYVLADRHAKYVTPSEVDDTDVLRRHRIDVPGAHLDWVPKGTVVALGLDDLPQRTTASGWVRDDRQRLERVAKVAEQYHKDPRKPVTLRVSGLVPHAAGGGIEVGELVLNIGPDGRSTEVNSLVTKITYEFSLSEGQVPSTTIETSHGELDVVGISQ